ncbi:hypothetical protein RclHR1_09420005 [Rhizophagus clarus]|uniref:Uncharacterized protein n=1 Tax=Rhizophagus clarus TaxID=94130 RepID=A0A2Z6SQ79_9GLOM|nr:hypothetical protein RclHR1_09420005 [Rhizophagus clarus]
MTTIFIKIIGKQAPVLKHYLVLKDSLSNIRIELEKCNAIDETLSFSKKSYENEFIEIVHGHEENFLLNDIIDKIDSCYYLYLVRNSIPSWNYLNEKRKLDYGRIMSFDGNKKASNRAFKLKDCEFKLMSIEGYKKGQHEFKSEEDWMMKKNLFFGIDINVQNFKGFGLPIVKTKEKFKDEINSTYNYTEIGKATLKLSKENLELTDEFKNDVEHAIVSKKPRQFFEIIEKYGQFLPTEIILGGRIYSFEKPTNKSEGSVGVSIGTSNVKIGGNSGKSSKKLNFHSSDHIGILGGKCPVDEKFDEKTWIESLEDYQTWDCIEFKNPVSIFKLLPDDLYKEAFKSIGKRILYTATEETTYHTIVPGMPRIFAFNMPSNILKIIQNKEADCNIFATVANMTKPKGDNANMTKSKGDIFTCQVLYLPNKEPRLIIHCIQKKFKNRVCKLKIKWMVIGYCTDFNFVLSDFNVQFKILKSEFRFNNQTTTIRKLYHYEHNPLAKMEVPFCLGIPVLTKLDSSNDSLVIGHHFFNAEEENKIGVYIFSYCVKNNCYVNLPDFTFYTLIISNYNNHNAFGIIPFEYSIMKKPHINFNDDIPEFISLYSTQQSNCGPILLQQEGMKVKIKAIDCECKCSFKDEPLVISKDSVKCAYIRLTSLSQDPEKFISYKQDENLSHSLLLDRYKITSTSKITFTENNSKWNISPYDGQPLVYTNINDSSDTYIDFPIVEITYKDDITLKSFRIYSNGDEFFAKQILIGGKLFIKEFSSATQAQVDILKFYLFHAYNSAKYSLNIQFGNLFTLNILPKMETLDGEKLNIHEKLINWMTNLYKMSVLDNDNLTLITSKDDTRRPGVTSFKEKLSLKDWVGNAAYDNLISWAIDFHLFRGLITNQNHEIKISKKTAVDIIKIPMVKSNEHNSKPTKEFEHDIEKAVNNMRPLEDLQRVFNEYGHLFPQRIILGKSLKAILPDSHSHNTFDDINDVNKILETLNSNRISHLITQKGKNVEKENLSYWIKNASDNLEIIEFDKIISLYNILGERQQKSINDILNKFNDFQNSRIIMTGITDLKDLEYLKDALKDEFKNNTRLEAIYVNFGLYDINGFYAIIEKLKEISIDITKCYISWVIVGIPSQLSVFSPNNREFQVECIKEPIKLQPNQSANYNIKTKSPLFEGYTIFAHTYHSSTNEPKTIIKLVKWSHNFIKLQISQYDLNDDSTATEEEINIDLRVCIPLTSYKSLRVDINKESECFLIGYVLTKENFDENFEQTS